MLLFQPQTCSSKCCSPTASPCPSAAGDRARAGQRQQHSLGSPQLAHPRPQGQSQPKGCFWGGTNPQPGWGARYSSQVSQEPSAYGRENPLDVFASLATTTTPTGGGEYPDASSLVICKMAQPWGATGWGALSSVRGGAELGARLPGMLLEEQEMWDGGRKSPFACHVCE